MGIYVFDYAYLIDTLSRDRSELDFGMHILPRAIDQDNVFAYPFYGYWRDVGTIQAYWEANMDVLRKESGISPQKWQIRTNIESEGRFADRAPARFGSACRLHSCMISAGGVINGTVFNSILGPGVVVEEGAVIKDSILFEDCLVRKGATVDLAILDKKVEVGEGAVVGHGENYTLANRLKPSHLYTGISLVGKSAVVPSGQLIGRNCVINIKTGPTDYPGKKIEDGESLLGRGEES
jgi:glucose-1-phosphate adenylyltransferase